ncbi:LCP family protein [Oceanobacillus halophilus]|uniref:Transcriptional regulator LytR n=1 Tax=Oceanobacillus halophilus TaxID=930130 RepID=A0A495A8F1_9BACI|nr:LCP family protein [Oceanobacillus halophilus]RKQ35854.1 transcriptional regulator LytR [Oceanobacillus halophilus]
MSVETRKNKKKRPLWQKVTFSVLAVVLLLVIGVGAYAFSIYNNAKQAVDVDMHEKVTSIDPKIVKQKVIDKEPLNILLLGVDKRGSDRGRSDALMVLTLNPKNDAMQLVSIPRDTRTMIVGKGMEDKINHAYAYGGADMSISTVENMLDIELDYFVQMNMEGLSDLVDVLGGITVNNDIAWEGSNGFTYSEGDLTLDGNEALGYVRMRKQDPRGDFGRTDRQRKVITGIINKGAKVGSVNKINGVIDVLGNNMTTNMEFKDMKDLLLNYSNVRHNHESYMLQGSGTNINGIYYYVIPDEEINKVSKMIKDMNS